MHPSISQVFKIRSDFISVAFLLQDRISFTVPYYPPFFKDYFGIRKKFTIKPIKGRIKTAFSQKKVVTVQKMHKIFKIFTFGVDFADIWLYNYIVWNFAAGDRRRKTEKSYAVAEGRKGF